MLVDLHSPNNAMQLNANELDCDVQYTLFPSGPQLTTKICIFIQIQAGTIIF